MITDKSEIQKRLLSNTNQRLAQIQLKFPSLSFSNLDSSQVRQVLMIHSSSRSGSSLLYTILRKLPFIYSLSGESVPFLKLSELLNDWNLTEEISVPLPQENIRVFENHFFCNLTCSAPAELDYNSFLFRLALRYVFQWPGINFDTDWLIDVIKKTIEQHLTRYHSYQHLTFHLELLAKLCKLYPQINPYYYDLPKSLIDQQFPDYSPSYDPPHPEIAVEEPPFILLSPEKHIKKNDLAKYILLLKTPANAYRMPFWHAIFPNAEFKVIHLTRNPAATINGLCDGWLHHGFYSRNIGISSAKPLKIAGYSDRFEWGKVWWKYDLPPGWEECLDKTLSAVCAYQWKTAHQSILDYLEQKRPSVLRMRYEDFIFDNRYETFSRIIAFLNKSKHYLENLNITELPLVQSIEPPKRYRWHKRKVEILPIIHSPAIMEMCRRLGYELDEKAFY